MRLQQTTRRLFLATWEVPAATVQAVLPAGFAPLVADGRGLLSMALERRARGRLGLAPAPAHSLLEVRTYAEGPDRRRGVVVLLRRVSLGGILCWFEGIPYRPTAIRLDRERAEVPGAGVGFRFELDEALPQLPSIDPPLGGHDTVFVSVGRPRRADVRLGPTKWRAAVIQGEPRAEPALALGFDVRLPRWALYAEDVPFFAELPARSVSS